MDTVLSAGAMRYITSDAYARSPALNHHHVAFVLSRKSGHVLGSGTNCATPSGSQHAEVTAMQQYRSRLRDRRVRARDLTKGVRVVSLRVSSSGELRLARPCRACFEGIARCPHAREVAWSTQQGQLECVRLDAPM